MNTIQHATATSPLALPPSSLEKFRLKVQEAGCPPDQIARFLAAGYVPLEWALPFHAAARQADRPDRPNRIALGGARGPGKSYTIFAQIALDDCQRFAGARVLYLRKVGKAAKESLDALREKLLGNTPHSYNRQEGIIKFPNGSGIITGHFQHEKDIDQYIGLEYLVIALEERTQLSQNKIEMLRGSLRSGNPQRRPREYSSTNPGGVGHTQFKAEFVLPHRAGKEQGTRFIPANWRDNPWLDTSYIRYLESLTGVLGRMWRDGDWDVGAGQYFVHWDYSQHVLSKWNYWPLPAHWPVWAGFDYGFGHPTSVHFFTEITGNLYTIAEHVQPYWLPKQHAAALKDIAHKIGRPLNMITFHAGHDCFSRESSGRTIAEQYSDEGVNMVPATINREQGAAAMLERLGDPQGGISPTWYILDTCPILAETIPAMQTSPHNAKDVIKVDADEAGEGGDDAYDSARYGVMANAAASGGGFETRSRS